MLLKAMVGYSRNTIAIAWTTMVCLLMLVLFAATACTNPSTDQNEEATVIPPVASSIAADEAFAGAPVFGADLIEPNSKNIPEHGECSPPSISSPNLDWDDSSIFSWDDVQWPLSATTTSVAISESGAIYVTGFTCGILDRINSDEWFGNSDAFVRRYKANGDLVWSRQFGTRGHDFGWGVAVGPDGNPVVSGITNGTFSGLINAGIGDLFLRKFDQDGNTLWTQQFGTSEDDRTTNAIAVGPNGSIFVAGETNGAIEANKYFGNKDGFVAKFSSSGRPEWIRQIGTDIEDGASSVVVSASGQIYVGGSTDGQLPGGTWSGGIDSFVVAFDMTGDVVWTRQFRSQKYDSVMAIDTDADGTVWVAGIYFGPGGGDVYIRSIDPSGESSHIYEFGTDGFDFLFGIQVKPNNQVIAVGYSEFGEDQQIMIARLDPNAETPSMKHFGTQTSDAALGVALDTNGAAYIVGELNRPGPSGRATERAAFIVRLAE